MSKTLEELKAFSMDLHCDQVDKAGMPYTGHLLRVMDGVDTYEEKVTALFHDSVEDGKVTLDHLKDVIQDQVIIDAIDAMTHRDDDTYYEYVTKLASNSVARKVKMADLRDNMNLDRLDKVTDKDLVRLDKYKRSYRYLENVEEEHK